VTGGDPTDGPQVVSLPAAFESFDERWAPRLAAEANGQAIKLARVEGEFVWHSHADADEVFLVVTGVLTVEFRENEDVTLEADEMLVVPAGVEHRPVADEEARVLLFEPVGTHNTGDTASDRNREVKRLSVD
jgi:mannose-6-phosphate isomerase-like protein (cupin superfamily)